MATERPGLLPAPTCSCPDLLRPAHHARPRRRRRSRRAGRRPRRAGRLPVVGRSAPSVTTTTTAPNERRSGPAPPARSWWPARARRRASPPAATAGAGRARPRRLPWPEASTVARYSMIASTWPRLLPRPASTPSLETSRRWCWNAEGGGDDAGRRRHGPLERLLGVRGAADVEHDGGAVLPRHLVLADHQLVVARRRPPVHPAQVVAHHVLPQRVELVALAADAAVVHRGAERVAVAAAGGAP